MQNVNGVDSGTLAIYLKLAVLLGGPFHGIRFVSGRTFTGFFIIETILGNYQQV